MVLVWKSINFMLQTWRGCWWTPARPSPCTETSASSRTLSTSILAAKKAVVSSQGAPAVWLSPCQCGACNQLHSALVERLNHKVHIQYIWSTTVYVPHWYPLAGIGTLPPPLSPAIAILPPGTKGGGRHTRLRVRGWESPDSDDWRKGLALYILCGLNKVMWCTNVNIK